jgi:hypothetical protein
VVLSLDGIVVTFFRFTGVLAGWIKGISGAVPQDLKGNSCFAVSPKRVGVGCVGSENKSPYFLNSSTNCPNPLHPQDFLNAMRRAAVYAHACGSHSDAAVISTCVKSFGA